jgi:polyketide biosynthesis 3-hydroxy-3-methylglutaryl-CoA synthase-like enzyme PksG
VSCAVTAAKPIVDALTPEERGRIDMVVVGSESGVDFVKSISTYVHHYLGLSRSCRLFEVKQACYGGTAALQTATGFVASQVSPGAKALVIGTDIGRATIRGSYVEPSQGAGAVAFLVSDNPEILELDFGANGYHGYEVMDTCRPAPDVETGDSDLSLIAYLDCLEHAFAEYARRVQGAPAARPRRSRTAPVRRSRPAPVTQVARRRAAGQGARLRRVAAQRLRLRRPSR